MKNRKKFLSWVCPPTQNFQENQFPAFSDLNWVLQKLPNSQDLKRPKCFEKKKTKSERNF